MAAKGQLVQVRWENQACTGPRLSNGNMAARKKRKYLARLHDFHRISLKIAAGTASQQEVANFRALGSRLGHPNLRDTRERIRVAKAELAGHEELVKNANLKAWKDRMNSSNTEVSMWLKAKDQAIAHSSCTHQDDGRSFVSSSVVEAAQTIFKYWQSFWLRLDRARPEFAARTEALLGPVAEPRNEVDLPLPSGAALFKQVRKGKGAGAPDGWSKHLPCQVFVFAQIARGWVDRGEPTCQSRMICRRASKEPLAWTLERGTASAAIHSWLLNRGWVLTEGWKWSHELAGVTLSLSTPRGAGAIEDRIGVAQRSIRQAWRAWVAVQWLHSDRHELRDMNLWREGGNGLRNLDWKVTRTWAHSSAPAATVATGASFSPATWARVSTNSRAILDRCVWNCGELGTFEHFMWHCKSRHSKLRKPSNALTARFGWSIKGARVPNLDLVRAWMCQAQLVMWKHNHPGRPPDLDV